MARAPLHYICNECGTVHRRWAGQCDSCGAWNTLQQQAADTGGIGGGPAKTSGGSARKGRAVPLAGLEGGESQEPRIKSGIHELDRVTGGGFVRGSALLVGGDPGIGKSTLLTQAAAALAHQGHYVIYVSGEEAVEQIRLRAHRLRASDAPVALAAETNVEDIIATLDSGKKPDLVIIDSIQTLWSDNADSAPGTVTQVRIGAQAMIRYAKKTGAAMVLVGHVTKDGQIAGPRVVEHMVDAVLYFEGDGGHHYRILRTVKNRFGATQEIGVFEMGDDGLSEVANPSLLFLGERDAQVSGSAVFAGMEGTRPVLVEVQALVAPSSLGTPRRAVVGWDQNRLAMILAVLEAHCGLRFGNHDVYLNVAGGYRISEPAADLAVAAAVVSSLAGICLPMSQLYFGEVSLSGQVRAVAHAASRLKEAEKLGFTAAVLPPIPTARSNKPTVDKAAQSKLKLRSIDTLALLVSDIAAQKQKGREKYVRDHA